MQTQWKKLQILAIAGALSFLGSSLTTFSVLLREKEASDSAIMIAVLTLAMAIPNIIFAPWAGLLADKYSSRQVIIPALLIMGASTTSIAFIPGSVWAFVALFTTAAAGVAVGASFRAAEATITTLEDMPRVQGMQSSYINIGVLFGPALSGTLVQTTGYFWPFIIDGISFALLAIVYYAVNVNRPGVAHDEGEKLSAMEGVRFVFRDRIIRSLVILVTVLIVALGVVNIGEMFLVLDVLNGDKIIYGFIGLAFGLGSILGAVLSGAIKLNAKYHAPTTIGSIAILVATVIAMGLAPNWVFLLFVSFIAGIANSALNAYAVGMIMQRATNEARGRIMSAVQAVITVGSVSSTVIAGVVLDLFDVRAVLVVGGVVSAVILVIFGPEVLKAAKAEPAVA